MPGGYQWGDAAGPHPHHLHHHLHPQPTSLLTPPLRREKRKLGMKMMMKMKRMAPDSSRLLRGDLRRAVVYRQREQALRFHQQPFGVAEGVERDVLPAHEAAAIDQEGAVQ